MARQARGDLFRADEIATIHVMNRVNRGEYWLGEDPETGKNLSHRQVWFNVELQRLLAGFAIDLLCEAIMGNHFHLILRSRPDVVKKWSDREVARRWLLIYPKRKKKNGWAEEPTDDEINSVRSDKKLLARCRTELSDISWLIRLVCQRIAQRANAEIGSPGKFWQNRFQAVRLLDEESLFACCAYVDLNPIRADIASTLEGSGFTSIQKRLLALVASLEANPDAHEASLSELYLQNVEAASLLRSHSSRTTLDGYLAPLTIEEVSDPLDPRLSDSQQRCSDKGFLPITLAAYADLLDWTARHLRPDKRGATPQSTPPVMERLNLDPEVWCQLVGGFGEMFSLVAGMPERVDQARGPTLGARYYLPVVTRQLLSKAQAVAVADAIKKPDATK